MAYFRYLNLGGRYISEIYKEMGPFMTHIGMSEEGRPITSAFGNTFRFKEDKYISYSTIFHLNKDILLIQT